MAWLAESLRHAREQWSEPAQQERLRSARLEAPGDEDAQALIRSACRRSSLLARLESEEVQAELCLQEYIALTAELLCDLAGLYGAEASPGALVRLYRAVFENDAAQLASHASPAAAADLLEGVLTARWGPEGGFYGMHFLYTHTLGSLAVEVFEDPDDAAEDAAYTLKAAENVREFFLEQLIGLAWADKQLTSAERQMISRRIAGANLSRLKQKSLKQALLRNKVEGRKLVSIPPAAKDLILEQMMLLSLIDGELSDVEWKHLETVAAHLEVIPERLMEIRVRVALYAQSGSEHFTRLQHVTTIGRTRHFFTSLFDRAKRTLYQPISVAHISGVVQKNVGRLTVEIKETVELNKLLLKATHTKLSADEQLRVKAQLLDIAKTIPSLAIFAMPGGGVLLPILIKVLPFNILPSAFTDDEPKKKG